MNEESMLYEALKRPLGLVVRGDAQRLRKARERLLASDPAMLTLHILGPDRAGQIFLLREQTA